MEKITITECPRDAMQGIHDFIPTEVKIDYLNTLMGVGFDVLDCGSFVSPKAVPQMKDTSDVLKRIDRSNSKTKLLVIVANERGAIEASSFDEVDIIGFPFSVSEEFQLRNTKKTRQDALELVKNLCAISAKSNKYLRVYLSMAFGNPYGEDWSPELVLNWGKKLVELGVKELALSDTIGCATAKEIKEVFGLLSKELPNTLISAHFHTTPKNWEENVNAAYESGCRSFDTSINGIGGCPMAKDDLTGNLATENFLSLFPFLLDSKLNPEAFNTSLLKANMVFL